MSPRLATINLDWLDSEIDAKMRALNSSLITADGVSFIMKVVPILRHIRSKCEQIEEPIEPFLSKTCVNDWESNKYCSNNGKCELCKIKQ